MAKKEKILFALILLFLFSLFFSRLPLFNIIATSLLALGALWFSPLKEKWTVFKEKKYLHWMVFFFAMIVLSVLLSENKDKGLRYLDSRLVLFYFPVTIGVLQLRKDFKNKVLLSFAILTTVMCLIFFFSALYQSDFFKHPEFLYNDSFTKLLGQQSVYTSLLVNISIYIFTWFIFFTPVKYKGWMILASLFLFCASYLLASRIMMGALYVSLLAFILFLIISRKKYLEGATLILGLLLGIFLVYKFLPKTFNRFKELAYVKFEYRHIGKESHYNMQVSADQWNGANFRLAAWRCGWELFLQNPVKGVDIGDKREELMKKYEEKNFYFAIQTNKNVHNNYLDILYSMGIIGLLLFIIAWIILPIMHAKKHRNGLAIIIIFSFAAAWITEIYFDRSLGGMLTGFFIPFLLTGKDEAK